MPAHNNAPYIGLAIESVLNQSHKNWELLIVDDASSDGTLEAAEAHQAEGSRIKVFDHAESLAELPIIEGLRAQRLNLQVVLFGPFKREAAEFYGAFKKTHYDGLACAN